MGRPCRAATWWWGGLLGLPLRAAWVRVAGVVALTVSRAAEVAVGRRQVPGGVVVLVVAAADDVVVVEAPGGVTVRLKVPCAPPYPSTTMKYVCPAVTVGVRREARNRPVELVHASSLHPASDPLAHAPLRR